MDILKVENAPGWVKNTNNKAVLNSNLTALQEHKANKLKNTQIHTMKSEVEELKSDISDIKQEFSELKHILIQFMNSNQNK
jgi:archaellum component FlaC